MKKIISLFVILLFVSNLQSQTGWNWQNPYPQGNPLYSISFNVHCGWAVGPHGTAIHWCDDTNIWEIVDLGTTENLNSVYMFDDLMTYIVGDNGLILYVMEHVASNSFEVTQYEGYTDENLNSITVNHNACPWVVGDNGTILRSDDLGISWEDQSIPFSNKLYQLDNIECTEAFAISQDGLVLYTSDLGNTWSYRNVPTSWDLFSVNIGTFENIRVVGQQGNIWHTDDKGLTWEQEHEESGYQLYDVINIGTNTAYAVGSDETILETIDYGETWTKAVTDVDLLYTPLHNVEDHWGQDHVWVVGHHGVILKNSGIQTEFELQNEGTLFALRSVEFIDENTGWAVGGDYNTSSGTSEGIILYTTNGGMTWEDIMQWII